MAEHAEAVRHGHLMTRAERLRANRVGLWLFIASEAFLFSAALAARYYLLGFYRPRELNQPLGFTITAILLLSGLFAYRAETAIAHDDRRGFLANLLVAIALGLAFMVGVGLEWKEGFEFFPPSTVYGSAFFTLTGMHAFHVLTGLVALALAGVVGAKGGFSSENYWGAEGAIKYWHFVDVVWVFVFPTLYLVS
jgi:cytochrome c oxidase subunit 3